MSRAISSQVTNLRIVSLELCNVLRATWLLFPTDVYFERRLEGFSDNALPRAKSAQLKLEHYYKIAVDAAIERNTRCVFMLRYNGSP